MGKLTKFTPRERVDVPDNVYYAQIKKIETKVWAPDNTSLNWTFEIAQPPFAGKQVWVWGSTGTTPTPKARLTQWGAVLGFNREQLVSDQFDTDQLVGSYVKIVYKTWTKDDGSEKQGVTDLLPMTDVDLQVLQGFLAQTQQTGSVKVAVESKPTVSLPSQVQPVSNPTPFVQTNLPPTLPQAQVQVPPVHGPVPGTANSTQTEPVRRRPSTMPF